MVKNLNADVSRHQEFIDNISKKENHLTPAEIETFREDIKSAKQDRATIKKAFLTVFIMGISSSLMVGIAVNILSLKI